MKSKKICRNGSPQRHKEREGRETLFLITV